ncbi:MAG: MogA/MoaB family molybdenum cofactor biosynthesis protein [Symbiobacteriaceae bacterium]|nr:MogA/MoaB family molybdenum cofactor biosynthesis protein [Symbiobacteriaceae bacterium]
MEQLVFRAGVITASDKGSVGFREDRSGPRIKEMLESIGMEVVLSRIVPDEVEEIAALLREAADDLRLDLVVTTGGTGLTPRDITPQATRMVIDYEVPGMAEAMRAEGLKYTPRAMLSRGIVGVRRFTLVVNLPGSEKAVSENLAVLLPVLDHALAMLRNASADCARE